MSHTVLEELCIGCGGCEYACPTGALTKTDSFLGLFAIDPYSCNDCGECVRKCPELAIVIEPDWAVCRDRGCPLSSHRFDGMECAFWLQSCPDCGTTLWRADATDAARADARDVGRTSVTVLTEPEGWSCPRCGMGMRIACPRTRKLGTTQPANRSVTFAAHA